MSTTRIGLSLVALALASTGVVSWLRIPSSAASEAMAIDDGRLTRVERRSFDVRVQLVGELQPVRSTTLSSQIASDRGKIVYLIDDGAEVSEGDVLVRFDPTPFQEEMRQAELESLLAESIVAARTQSVEWERAQAKRREKTAEFELEVATLERYRFEKGEGPLELARLESELRDQEAALEEHAGFLEELGELLLAGHVNEAEIHQVEKRAEKASQTAELARRQYETYRDFILPSRLAALKHKIEQAAMELEQTRVSNAFKIGESEASLEAAARDLDAAQSRLEQAKTTLERTTITAPLSGMVVHREEFRDGERRKPRVGDSVWQNQPLLYLPDLTRMVVLTQVREVDVHKVQPGHGGEASFDAYPELALAAAVRSIGVLAEREGLHGGEKTFRVTAELVDGDTRLRPGMTARLDILSEAVADALVIPIQALWERGGRTWCWVATADGVERRDVRVGARSHHFAEVLEGLVEGDVVSLVAPDAEDGGDGERGAG